MKSKSIQLFAFDQKHNLQYQGNCKLQIDRISSMLIVEPEHEEYIIKSARFECGFVMNKNVLFVVAEQELNDFVLIFDDEERCKNVYDLILADKATNDVKEDKLFDRFLVPLCKGFIENDDATIKLKEVVAQLIDKQDVKKEKNTTEMNNASGLLCSSNSTASQSYVALVEADDNDNERSLLHGKRRHYQLDRIHIPNGNGDIHKQTRTYAQIASQELYKLIHIKAGMYIRRRLLIFSNAAKTECYQYSWSKERKLYYCIGCEALGKDVTAVFDKDENGFKCIKLEDEKHSCTPIPYTPTSYTKIYKKPDYEIVGNSDAGLMLIIFAEDDKSRCWEFQVDSTRRLFSCCKCSASGKLVNKNTRNEYVEMRDAVHVCEYIPYEPNNYCHLNDFVPSPGFEVQLYTKNGQEKKRLIIFDKTDRNLCHVYCTDRLRFVCYPCRVKGIQVSAKVFQYASGEEYVMLSKKKHICKLRIYSELSKKEVIVRPPDFELMDNTHNGIKKLFIFDSNDRNLCYTFSLIPQRLDRYYCHGCKNKKMHKGSFGKRLSAALHKGETGEYYVRLINSEHICEPTKYEPEKYARKEDQKCYDFFFFQQKRFSNSINVAIYHPEDNTLCYQLNFNKSPSQLKCNRCYKKGGCVNTRIEKDETGNEFFVHDYKKHVCHPVKVSSICSPKFVILERNEINFKVKEKKKLKIDEDRIVKSPNFELHPNRNGLKDGFLFVFHSEDQKTGYKYYYRSDEKSYVCSKRLCYVSAKLQIQENGEVYVIMGKAEHKCEPVNFMKTQ